MISRNRFVFHHRRGTAPRHTGIAASGPLERSPVGGHLQSGASEDPRSPSAPASVSPLAAQGRCATRKPGRCRAKSEAGLTVLVSSKIGGRGTSPRERT